MSHTPNIVACVWDFDNVLTPKDLQELLIYKFGLETTEFQDELEALAQIYAEKGISVNPVAIFLNHLISYAEKGEIKNFNSKAFREIGEEIQLYPGVSKILDEIKSIPSEHPDLYDRKIIVNHYVITQVPAEIVRGTSMAFLVSGIYGSELVDTILPPAFRSRGFNEDASPFYKAIGEILDPFKKASVMHRIALGINNSVSKYELKHHHKKFNEPNGYLKKLIYVGSGFNSLPSYDWVNNNFGKAFSVYNPSVPRQFEESDMLLRRKKVEAYGPADFTSNSNTSLWLKMHVLQMCEELAGEVATVKV